MKTTKYWAKKVTKDGTVVITVMCHCVCNINRCFIYKMEKGSKTIYKK